MISYVSIFGHLCPAVYEWYCNNSLSVRVLFRKVCSGNMVYTAKPLFGDGLQRCPVTFDQDNFHVNFTKTFSDGIRVFMNGNRRTLPHGHCY